MATAATKTTFPVVPDVHWWALRKRFQQTIPGVVSPSYLASVLNMKENSARANVLPALKLTKIIDDDGKPLARAKKWRDDEQYPAVCEEIRRDCYPQDLLDAVLDPSKDRPGATRWFANHTGAGKAAVGKMVKFYTLLSEADPAKATGEGRQSEKFKEGAEDAAKKRSSPTGRKKVDRTSSETPERQQQRQPKDAFIPGPSVHINLQVHISADASTEQIDQMFASIAKHIYRKATG